MDAARKYHHGNLKEAFLKAARDLLERDGLGGLSLRKCAEKVGVSHAAPPQGGSVATGSDGSSL